MKTCYCLMRLDGGEFSELFSESARRVALRDVFKARSQGDVHVSVLLIRRIVYKGAENVNSVLMEKKT
ncbi:unnamed protein product [Anisakis simplex]|uniref:BLUF domain-containing protein n=1 Tax=Anisakis simplex TaxID=6269 RepID=A0A0M3KHM1_ANISI|nr:unnamed protein product [Anisakis simplex]